MRQTPRPLTVLFWTACLSGSVIAAGIWLGQDGWSTYFLALVIGALIGPPVATLHWPRK